MVSLSGGLVSVSKVLATAFAIAVALSACTNSTVLSTVYDRLASNSAKRFKSYATLDQNQDQKIDWLVNSFHSWHRGSELARYAALLNRIADDTESQTVLESGQVQSWWQSVRDLTDDMRDCNPLNASAELLAGLSDKQVSQIAERLRADHNQREDEYLRETDQGRIERRFSDIRKWASRSGASFNARQDALLRKTLGELSSVGRQRYQLRRVWMEQFIALLKRRKRPQFEQRVVSHINSVWRLTESRYPDQWQSNERLWVEFIKDFINLQSDAQRDRFLAKIRATATTFNKLSAKESGLEPVCHSVK